MKIAGKQRLADSSDVPPSLPPHTYSAKRVSTFMCASKLLLHIITLMQCLIAGLVSSKVFYQFCEFMTETINLNL